MDWFTSDNSEYGTYAITFTAVGPDGATASVSYSLDVKRQCLDALFFIKVQQFPSYIPY